MNPLEHFDRLTFQQPGDVLPRPHDNCYWLLPGRIIAGEYPRNFDDETSRVKLRKILAAGVTQFIDLTEAHELKPYVELMQSEATLQGLLAKHAASSDSRSRGAEVGCDADHTRCHCHK